MWPEIWNSTRTEQKYEPNKEFKDEPGAFKVLVKASRGPKDLEKDSFTLNLPKLAVIIIIIIITYLQRIKQFSINTAINLCPL